MVLNFATLCRLGGGGEYTAQQVMCTEFFSRQLFLTGSRPHGPEAEVGRACAMAEEIFCVVKYIA